MRRFVRVDVGVVVEIFPSPDIPPEIIPPDKDIRSLYHPDFSKSLIEVTEMDVQPSVGWAFSDGTFSPPVPMESII